MSVYIIDLPSSHYSPLPLPRCALATARPSLLWQVLALVLAVAGLSSAGMAAAVGLLPLTVALLWLALPPAVGGLGITAGLFATEVVILCGAGC